MGENGHEEPRDTVDAEPRPRTATELVAEIQRLQVEIDPRRDAGELHIVVQDDYAMARVFLEGYGRTKHLAVAASVDEALQLACDYYVDPEIKEIMDGMFPYNSRYDDPL